MSSESRRIIDLLLHPSALWRLLREYFTSAAWRHQPPIRDTITLKAFLNERASYVAQVSLYGYLRTRAGMRYPELFEDDSFVRAINIAKWQIWLACLADLAVYTGGLLLRQPGTNEVVVAQLMQRLVNESLDETGVPGDAGGEYANSAVQVRQRVATCNWQAVSDDEGPFSASPDALVMWAPIVDDLKQLDEEIVRNSIRFRWQAVRRDLRKLLDVEAVLAAQH